LRLGLWLGLKLKRRCCIAKLVSAFTIDATVVIIAFISVVTFGCGCGVGRGCVRIGI
jgi:hypothetical protein